MKLWKSRKALSPVVASIILIAVTVAVSIAVAAWMGALSFGFMGTEQLQITNMEFDNNNIAVTVNNTGTVAVTIREAWVNGVKKPATVDDASLPVTIEANEGKVININVTWTPGSNYQVRLVSSKGNQFTYQAYAPAS